MLSFLAHTSPCFLLRHNFSSILANHHFIPSTPLPSPPSPLCRLWPNELVSAVIAWVWKYILKTKKVSAFLHRQRKSRTTRTCLSCWPRSKRSEDMLANTMILFCFLRTWRLDFPAALPICPSLSYSRALLPCRKFVYQLLVRWFHTLYAHLAHGLPCWLAFQHRIFFKRRTEKTEQTENLILLCSCTICSKRTTLNSLSGVMRTFSQDFLIPKRERTFIEVNF
jgi:hypothetical protein